MSLSSVHVPSWGEVGDWLVGDPLRIVTTIALAIVLRWIVGKLIDRVVATATSRHADRLAELPGAAGRVVGDALGISSARHVQRTRTMGAVLKSIASVLILGVALLTVMALLGMPLGPLLTSAGIGGVAIGFGAQSLVKDFLSGIFMILEDQYGVGDIVDTGTVTGTVEDVTLRVTKIRDPGGIVWYVRNGEIVRIGNKSQGWSTGIVDIPVAIGEDLEKTLAVMRRAVSGMVDEEAWHGKLLEPPMVVGVESMAPGSMSIRIIAKCAPNEHFAVQREIRQRVKDALDAAGIRGPLPVYATSASTEQPAPPSGGPAPTPRPGSGPTGT